MDTETHGSLFKEETHQQGVRWKCLNYLKITGLRVGLLLNLSYAKLQ